MVRFQTPSPRLLAVPGIGYSQNILIGEATPDLPAFRERSVERLDPPTRPRGWIFWHRSSQPSAADRR
jgi:hypothetical protein